MAFPKQNSSSAKEHFIASQLLQIQASHSQSHRRNTIAMPPASAQQNRATTSSSSSASSSASSSRHNSSSSSQNVTLSTSAPQSSVIRALLLPVVVLMSLLSICEGLACYETVNGRATILQNDSWTYCALVPATIHGNEYINGTQFGMGPDTDLLFSYNAAFSMNEDEYRILTVCIYERYDFSRFLPMRPDTAVEFTFRCVCNYDLCNSEPTFSAYLGAIKAESFAAKKK
ncbi:hypothetical protein DdX_08301 [Ditylenchus destructor]|uniref:Uncharacterized protein n=1 Tax=Ditylenchus destructor TaxID=166010 RepID=A0AAD4N6A2_9BILA|nr:hypothetical protein DdX_08301 [Ditylenchus destructor]